MWSGWTPLMALWSPKQKLNSTRIGNRPTGCGTTCLKLTEKREVAEKFAEKRMKLKFKKQAYQTNAVDAVADCFLGQHPPARAAMIYKIDPGRTEDAGRQMVADLGADGFKNADLVLTPGQVLENIHAVQRRQNLPLSAALVKTKVCDINLDVEMETGTGKTYC